MAKYIKTEEGYKSTKDLSEYDVILKCDMSNVPILDKGMASGYSLAPYIENPSYWSFEKGSVSNIDSIIDGIKPKILLKIPHTLLDKNNTGYIPTNIYVEPCSIYRDRYGTCLCFIFNVPLDANVTNFKTVNLNVSLRSYHNEIMTIVGKLMNSN